jgi:uncharacterized membrane protein (UPF0136 family)
MLAAAIYLLVFGVLTIAGGVLGFVKAKSRASLVAGSIAGLLLLAAGGLSISGQRMGPMLGAVVSLLLAVRFGLAYRKTQKPMPALPMLVLSAIGIVIAQQALAP